MYVEGTKIVRDYVYLNCNGYIECKNNHSVKYLIG